MGITPAPNRLVVALSDPVPGVGGMGKGEIVAIGDEVLRRKLSYTVGDTVLFGRTKDLPVLSGHDGDIVVLGADDVLASWAAKGDFDLIDPDATAAPEQDAPSLAPSSSSTKLDDYIRQLRDLAK